MKKNAVIVVLGTTASGKTDLALVLAKKYKGEIISADSRQVYRGMDIGTGKEFQKYKKAKVPCHLIDVVSTKSQFTVASYQRQAYKAIEGILKRWKVPIICGGTGLYIDAVTKGYILSRSKITKYELRKVRKKLEALSLHELLRKLKNIDSKTYNVIDKKNRRRVQRAIEIFYETGVPKSQQSAYIPPPYIFVKIGITHAKPVLKKRIARRLNQHLKEGLYKEVTTLKKTGLSWRRIESFGLEYRWAAFFLQKQISFETMRSKLLQDILSFAKRQTTWFKRDKNIKWIRNKRQAFMLVRRFLSSS